MKDSEIRDIFAGDFSSFILMQSGQLYGFGVNSEGKFEKDFSISSQERLNHFPVQGELGNASRTNEFDFFSFQILMSLISPS